MNTLQRRKTHQVLIDHITVGSEAPVVIQSMTNTDTADAKATALQIKELSDLKLGNGADYRQQPRSRPKLPKSAAAWTIWAMPHH